ncbi:hypothetical protein, partial [Acinetobacter colistiniresistens]|uniref:hypothetical protein n=1 Tax=Acinetobacter colistiniresistens TaxID=280145 RepID=UPI001BB1E222
PYYFDCCGIARIGMTGMVRTGMGGRFIQYFAVKQRNCSNKLNLYKKSTIRSLYIIILKIYPL